MESSETLRPSWDGYFMDMARMVATRATCPRKHVGCVIVRSRQVLTSGYNGSLPGQPHCEDVGCMMEENHCVRTTHAEINAVALAARSTACLLESTAYVTLYPCWPCFKALVTAGVRRIVYAEAYRESPYIRDYLASLGILDRVTVERIDG